MYSEKSVALCGILWYKEYVSVAVSMFCYLKSGMYTQFDDAASAMTEPAGAGS